VRPKSMRIRYSFRAPQVCTSGGRRFIRLTRRIARVWGFIRLCDGTRKDHLPLRRAQDTPNFLSSSEAVPSPLNAQRGRFGDVPGGHIRGLIEPAPTIRCPQPLLARSKGERDRSARPVTQQWVSPRRDRLDNIWRQKSQAQHASHINPTPSRSAVSAQDAEETFAAPPVRRR
jgi:hypothetical protein